MSKLNPVRPVIVATALLLATGAGCTQPTETPSPAGLYDRYCALCHGPEGLADTTANAPQLNNPAFLAAADDDYLFAAIAQGRPGTTMTSFHEDFRGPLTEDQIWALVGYIREWGPVVRPTLEPVTGTGDPAAGAQAYRALCAECHGEDGRSDTAPDLANPVFQATASDAYIRQGIVQGRPGTEMQPFDLGDQVILDLIAYIRTLPDAAGP